MSGAGGNNAPAGGGLVGRAHYTEKDIAFMVVVVDGLLRVLAKDPVTGRLRECRNSLEALSVIYPIQGTLLQDAIQKNEPLVKEL